MAMSFSILWSISTGPFFIYLLYLYICLYYSQLFSPQNGDISHVMRNSIFFLLIEIFLKLELESNLNNWAKCCSDLSLKKKNALFWRERSFFFSVKQPCHRISSNFILSMFSREIYSKFYVVFTPYKNAKIKKKTSWKTSWKMVKKYFLRLQLIIGFYFSIFFLF